jgi:K(+)-stimulated pyrophosphate-energized sodium pump
MLAGFFGMQAATRANVRTSQAAVEGGQAKALGVAFSGGAVMGLSVASLGLVGLGIFFLLFINIEPGYISGFAMGASSIALFARVGGGIYTKAADVGSDLVGKVEAGIPEDDPRNPGVIADNVGDCVGDTAGMGADIFESYVGAIVAAIAIGATLGAQALGYMTLPLLVVVLGLVASLIGIASMQILQNFDPASALRYATFLSTAILLLGSYFLVVGIGLPAGIYWAILAGSVGGRYCHRPLYRVLHGCQTNPTHCRGLRDWQCHESHYGFGSGHGEYCLAGHCAVCGDSHRLGHWWAVWYWYCCCRHAEHGGHYHVGRCLRAYCG